MNPVLSVVLRILGIGALVAGGLAIALAWAILLGPLVFWIEWNVLDFGPTLGLPELGLWGSCSRHCSSSSAGSARS